MPKLLSTVSLYLTCPPPISITKLNINEPTIITACTRRMGKVMFLQVSVRSYPRGVPKSQVLLSQVSGPRWFQGAPKSQIGGGGLTSPRQGYPCPGQGVPQSWVGYPRAWVSPIQDRTGIPHSRLGQKGEYLLCGERYASCGHAGGLSCLLIAITWQ